MDIKNFKYEGTGGSQEEGRGRYPFRKMRKSLEQYPY